ncbi:MAG TPA: hypothetical protein DD454_03430 [Candidatus Moranbacteria bacterium]|nr:hypothetical protein [Candidatus Moranbacteria bacterium]
MKDVLGRVPWSSNCSLANLMFSFILLSQFLQNWEVIRAFPGAGTGHDWSSRQAAQVSSSEIFPEEAST